MDGQSRSAAGGVIVVEDDTLGAAQADGTVTRRPRRTSAIIAATAIGLLGLLVVAAILSGDDPPAEDTSPTPSSVAPTTAPPSEPSSSPAAADDAADAGAPDSGAPGDDTNRFPDPDVEGSFPIGIDTELVAALPPTGIDAWLFELGDALVRTDLQDGNQVGLDIEGFAAVMVGDVLAVVDRREVHLVDPVTLEFESYGVRTPEQIVTADDRYLYLTWVNDIGDGGRSLVRFDTETGLSTRVAIDPLGIGLTIAGAHDGSVRLHTPLAGSWELGGDEASQFSDAVLAGTNGGTLELRCGSTPSTCEPVVRDLVTGQDTTIALDSLQNLRLRLSPDLRFVTTADSLIGVDGSTRALPEAGETWEFSSDGRWVSDRLRIISVSDPDLEPIVVPRTRRALFQPSIIVDR